MKPCSGNNHNHQSGDNHHPERGCGDCTVEPLPKYYEDCPPKYCPDYCEGLPGGAKEVWAKYASAVVRVHSQWYFTTETNPPKDSDELQNVEVHGNGFFIHKKHVIVVPAHLVLAPPNASLSYNQLPFSTNGITGTVPAANPPVGRTSVYKGEGFYPANRILVDVIDVNGGKHSYTYQATILGFSGFNDLALLHIDSGLPWNSRLPCIKGCHPHFRFGCSRKNKPGEVVYAVGDGETRSLSGINNYCNALGRARSHQIYEGTLSDNRHLDYAGYAQPELVAVNDLPIFGGRSGLPIIDKFGHVIGMQTLNVTGSVGATNSIANTNGDAPVNGAPAVPGSFNTTTYVAPNSDGFVAGPSQFALLHVIKTLLCPNKPCNRDFVELLESEFRGDIWRYKQGFLGLAWEVFHGGMYQSHRSNVGWEVATLNATLNNPNEDPNVIKEVIGLRVVGLAKDTAGVRGGPNANPVVAPVNPKQTGDDQNELYLPDFGTPNPLNNSSLLAKDVIHRNDVIVFADMCPLGDLTAPCHSHSTSAAQIPISLVLARKQVGEQITLTVRQFSDDTGYLASAVSKKYTTVRSPLFYDFPWYKYYGFPWLKTTKFSDFYDNTFPYLNSVVDSANIPVNPVKTVLAFDRAGIKTLNQVVLTTPVI